MAPWAVKVIALVLALSLAGCGPRPSVAAEPQASDNAKEEVEEIRVLVEPDVETLPEPEAESEAGSESEEGAIAESGPETTAEPEPESAPDSQTKTNQTFTSTATYQYTDWSEDVAPEYYRIVDYSQVTSSPAVGTAEYASLDSLGRSGQAIACVTYEMMEAGRARNRKSLSDISPSGWGHNEEVDIELVDGSVYHGKFWNRSHLIAKSLGGDDVVENLVTGTRMQNVGSNRGGGVSGGMAYCENLARMWLEDNQDGYLTYVATPVYEGDELVCRSVIVDMLSSDGEMNVRIEVFNAAKGYVIDYADGTFAASES